MYPFTLERRKIIVTATLKGPNDEYDYLFDKTIPNFNVGVVRLPIQILVDGLIGMDFLQKFQRIKIHFDKQAIEAE